MEPEQFVAAFGLPSEPARSNSTQKHGGIFQYQWQPVFVQAGYVKKSTSQQNSVAVSETHIFAAQHDRPVVNVYNRRNNKSEGAVNFPEKITALAVAAANSILILGTEKGRLLLWETFSGRLVSTPESHLQPVTALAVDPTSNFALSASSDSNLHVWSLPALLDFSFQPNAPTERDAQPLIHTVEHRDAITAVACGHSYGSGIIAVSAGADKTAIVWDLRKGTILRTYFLHDVALALAMDVLDRGFYAAHEDGSIRLVSFYDGVDSSTTAIQTAKHDSITVQPDPQHRWPLPGAIGDPNLDSAVCLLLSQDGSRLLSGHLDGTIVTWNVATRSCERKYGPLPGPVTNLVSSPKPNGSRQNHHRIAIRSVVKPRAVNKGELSFVPETYKPVVQFVGLTDESQSRVGQAITHSSLPIDMLEAGLMELANWGQSEPAASAEKPSTEEWYLALDVTNATEKDDEPTMKEVEVLQEENAALREQVKALQSLQKASFQQLRVLREERRTFREQKNAADERHIKDEEALHQALGIPNPAVDPMISRTPSRRTSAVQSPPMGPMSATQASSRRTSAGQPSSRPTSAAGPAHKKRKLGND